MKASSLRRLRAQGATYAPRLVRRRPGSGDAPGSAEAPAMADPAALPELVFDRTTGPFGTRTDEDT